MLERCSSRRECGYLHNAMEVTCTTRKLVAHLIYHVNKRSRIEKQYDNISVPKLGLPHKCRSLPLRHQQELPVRKLKQIESIRYYICV